MRRSRQEITDKKEIDDIIMSSQTARIAVNREGCPYIVPMNFAYSDSVFYFHCASEGLKLDLLKSDPRICIEIDIEKGLKADNPENPCSWGFIYRSVIAEGKAEFIEDIEQKRIALNLIVNRFSERELPPDAENAIRSVTVFRVRAESMTAKRSG